jgi:D-lactate dehydrogenase
MAVVRPGSLLELWHTVQACIAEDRVIIMQAANTGLTGGSTPEGAGYDREVVIINALRIRKLYVICGGRQVICLPGTTLDQLERMLRPFGREPHSVIGSSCIGASVLGGLCNNSGGALVQRGPAFTEVSLFAQVTDGGRLELVNHLGMRVTGTSPEEVLDRLDRGTIAESDWEEAPGRCHDTDYLEHVRNVAADTPSRFNSDPRCLFEASGCAGKIVVFAARLDTFPSDPHSKTFYIGTRAADELALIRRRLLTKLPILPISGEYLHRDAFNVSEQYGKDTFLLLRFLGTRIFPALAAAKARMDGALAEVRWLPAHATDHVLQAFSGLFPLHLPTRLRAYRDRFEHHLILKVAASTVEATRHLLGSLLPSDSGDYFECAPGEARSAFLHRFAAAGAAVRYHALHRRKVAGIISLDIALRRNDPDWFEKLPAELEESLALKLYYGHFLCHVFHQDYVVRQGHDIGPLEARMLHLLDARGAKYPAEHNVGHLYRATPNLGAFYRSLDPRNIFNPGVGQLSKHRNWRDPAP